jgi:hypothetical protein
MWISAGLIAIAYVAWARRKVRSALLLLDIGLAAGWALILGPALFFVSPLLLVPVVLAGIGALLVARPEPE